MDRGHGNQYNSGHGHNNGSSSYSYGHTQSDPFHSFINEDEGAFDNTWQTPDFSGPQQSGGNEFEHNVQTWQETQYHGPETNFLPMPQYGVDPNYAAAGSNFQYAANFDSNGTQAFVGRHSLESTPYPGTNHFNTNSLNNGPTYDYAHAQQSEQSNQTISPAAITTYPDLSQSSFRKVSDDLSLQTSQGSQLAQSQPPVPQSAPLESLSISQWRQLANRSVKSIDRPGLHIKPTNQFENVTQTKRFNGFIFVGSSSVAVNSSKANVPRYKRKKSRNEALRLLQNEKGDGPWHTDREPLVKKLKVAAKKQAGPKTLTSNAHNKRSSSPSGSSESESDDSSAYSSGSEPDKEADEPSPLPSVRPTDPNKAVEYDIVKAIWAKRSSALSGPVIRTALAEVWEILKGVRDKWKTKATHLQQAIEKKDQATEKAFERRVSDQRRLLEACNSLIIKHGHPSIVEKLGENPVMLVIYYQFLADRIKYGEYAGGFINSILTVMSRSPNIDSSLLEKTKVDKLLPRILKRGDSQGKALIQRILSNAKIADKKLTPTQKVNGTTSKLADSKISSADGPKKANPSDSKALSVDADSKVSDSITSNKNKTTTNDTKSSPKSKSEPSTTDQKTKVVSVAAKPSGFFSSLKSASKRPGKSTKTDDSSSIIQEKKTETVSVPPKPAFSFAATMAGLAKQKEEVPVKSEEFQKPETAEEKAKRLRKESRRKLRVSFKNDEELVSVKTFVHAPEEESGHDQSQTRDVGDSKGEGQMLKMHKELELDDEEDYEPPEEILLSWTTPQLIDFSEIQDSERDRGYVSRGGKRDIESEARERETQKEREAGTLMAIYASSADVPSTPREPNDEQAIDASDAKSFGEPSDLTKARETESQIRINKSTPAQATPAPDISALLSIINSTKQQAPNSFQPQAPIQQPADAANPLAAIFAKFSNDTQAQTSQAPPQQQPNLQFNLQAALASMQQPQQNYQTQPSYNPPAVNPVPNLQAILSQIGTQSVAPQPPPMQNYGYQNDQPGFPINEDRKRQLENDDADHDRKRARGGKPFAGTPYLPCRFWQEGKCRKGDACTFLHENS